MDMLGALRAASMIRHEGEPLTVEDLEWDDIDDMVEAVKIWRQACRQEQAAKQVRKVAATMLAGVLGEGGAVRYGDNIIRYRPVSKQICIDPDGAAEYMRQQIIDGELRVEQLVNPVYAKRSWMSDSIRDTFYERVQTDPALTVVPVNRSPAYLRDLKDGESVTPDS